jgi:hypothetical protein
MAVKIAILSDPPSRLALLLGDCVHDYRSALDHLAFALPRVKGADPKWEDWSQFPVCDASTKFENVKRRYLCGVAGTTVTAVEELQPYFGRHRPEGHGLWYLRELSNLDKHRLSPLIYEEAAHGSIQAPRPPTGTSHIIFATGRQKHGATIAKIYLSDPAPPEMEVEINLTFGITLGDMGVPDMEVLGVSVLLERIHRGVVRAICALEPLLT